MIISLCVCSSPALDDAARHGIAQSERPGDQITRLSIRRLDPSPVVVLKRWLLLVGMSSAASAFTMLGVSETLRAVRIGAIDDHVMDQDACACHCFGATNLRDAHAVIGRLTPRSSSSVQDTPSGCLDTPVFPCA